jgi:hypothetical protein
LEAVIIHIKNMFQNNSGGVKKFKYNASNNEEKQQYSLAPVVADIALPCSSMTNLATRFLA